MTFLATSDGQADPKQQSVPPQVSVAPSAQVQPKVAGGTATSGSVETADPANTIAAAPSSGRGSSGYRGALVVNSRPSGARVFINDRLAGRTPLTVHSMPVGSRAVRVALDGYGPWSRAVSVVANRSTTVVATLDPARR